MPKRSIYPQAQYYYSKSSYRNKRLSFQAYTLLFYLLKVVPCKALGSDLARLRPPSVQGARVLRVLFLQTTDPSNRSYSAILMVGAYLSRWHSEWRLHHSCTAEYLHD